MILFEIIIVMVNENAILKENVMELLGPKKMSFIILMRQIQIVPVPYLDRKQF